jgi:predicted phage terminase large subunit-like protein
MIQPSTISEYHTLVINLSHCNETEKIKIVRYLCRTDLYFLLWWAFGRRDVEHPWLLARCKEVQMNPDGYLDLWARDHYKSTIITYAKTIQDILASHGDDPLPRWEGLEPTFGIFSHTRPIAKGFLRQIKREMEGNGLLKSMFPDVLWESPQKEAPKWSEDDGLVVKRKNNPKESTVEAYGLVEGQPTSKHFNVLIYDDVVTQASVYTPDMMKKTLESWEMSTNLGSKGSVARYIGTRYHFNDAYREIIKRGAAIPRIYAGTHDGTMEGNPVFKTKEELAEKRRNMGPYTFSTQILQNPLADETQSLKREWIKWHGGTDGTGMNKYLLVDPANEKKKTSDYTAMFVIGLGEDNNYYVLDMVRDRLNLLERVNCLFNLHRKWKPLAVGYEKYGMQADIEHIRDQMNRKNYHFNLLEAGGKLAKIDRIKNLIPTLAQGRWYFPDSIFKTTYDGRTHDLVDGFINEEFLAFPVAVHDDMLDCMARILDPDLHALWPRTIYDDEPNDRYRRGRKRSGSAWAA